jgi:predicted dithiol-disulfide oxidoreductase (DUF899 family)
MELPPIVSAQEWASAREELLVEEKKMTRALDALAARRRRLPVVEFAGRALPGCSTGAASSSSTTS